MILSKARVKEIKQDINNCKYKNEKDYMILDLCDTLLSQMPCKPNKVHEDIEKYYTEIETEGPKDINGKTDWSVMPWDTIEDVCKIFEYGKEKYGAPFTYRKGIKFSKLYSAILRHLFAWWKGNDEDKESGYKHLAHIQANVMMLMSMEDKKEFDDRDKI